jgi:hypothetical protein
MFRPQPSIIRCLRHNAIVCLSLLSLPFATCFGLSRPSSGVSVTMQLFVFLYFHFHSQHVSASTVHHQVSPSQCNCLFIFTFTSFHNMFRPQPSIISVSVTMQSFVILYFHFFSHVSASTVHHQVSPSKSNCLLFYTFISFHNMFRPQPAIIKCFRVRHQMMAGCCEGSESKE